MGFKLGSEKRGYRIPGKSNSPFLKNGLNARINYDDDFDIRRTIEKNRKWEVDEYGDPIFDADGNKIPRKQSSRFDRYKGMEAKNISNRKSNKSIAKNPYYENTDWRTTKDDGKGYDNFDLNADEGKWWRKPKSDGEYGGEDASQVDGKARWDRSEPDDSTYGYGPGGWKDPKSHPQFRNKKYIIGAQSKWKPFASGFGPRSHKIKGSQADVTQMSKEQVFQKMIAEKLYEIANRDVASAGPTTAGIAAQGAHFEAAYHSKKFRDFVKDRVDELVAKGGDPSKLMIDDLHKWKSYDQI